jgi:hypothetical protein
MAGGYSYQVANNNLAVTASRWTSWNGLGGSLGWLASVLLHTANWSSGLGRLTSTRATASLGAGCATSAEDLIKRLVKLSGHFECGGLI